MCSLSIISAQAEIQRRAIRTTLTQPSPAQGRGLPETATIAISPHRRKTGTGNPPRPSLVREGAPCCVYRRAGAKMIRSTQTALTAGFAAGLTQT